jgi:hypothetical protein
MEAVGAENPRILRPPRDDPKRPHVAPRHRHIPLIEKVEFERVGA